LILCDVRVTAFFLLLEERGGLAFTFIGDFSVGVFLLENTLGRVIGFVTAHWLELSNYNRKHHSKLILGRNYRLQVREFMGFM
jgi:hypothetical protein